MSFAPEYFSALWREMTVAKRRTERDANIRRLIERIDVLVDWFLRLDCLVYVPALRPFIFGELQTKILNVYYIP
jgi:hypothetical protein